MLSFRFYSTLALLFHRSHRQVNRLLTERSHKGLILCSDGNVCQAWPGVPVARGAPHAAMRCQQTLLTASFCSVTYIGRTLLSFSPQQSEPKGLVIFVFGIWFHPALSTLMGS